MIYICISTVYSRLQDLDLKTWPKSEKIKYIVSCQGEVVEKLITYERKLQSIFGPDVIIVFLTGFGLSRNRNATLNKALQLSKTSGDYIYICDDDLEVNIEGILKATDYCLENEIDLLAGNVLTDSGYFKKYSQKEYRLNILNSAKVSSVEMLVSVQFLKEKNLKFDEDFGLGSRYPSGEEYIFCTDLIKCKGKAIYVPITLCYHPPVSSGADFFSSNEKIQCKGAMLSRIFGLTIGSILASIFAISKLCKYKHIISLFHFWRQILIGVFKYRRS